MADFGITEFAAIATALAAVGTATYTIAQGSPAAPNLSKLVPPQPTLPGAPPTPPPTRPDTSIESEEQKARQRAAMRMRDMQSRQSAPSTALSAPLGVSTTQQAGSTVLRR